MAMSMPTRLPCSSSKCQGALVLPVPTMRCAAVEHGAQQAVGGGLGVGDLRRDCGRGGRGAAAAPASPRPPASMNETSVGVQVLHDRTPFFERFLPAATPITRVGIVSRFGSMICCAGPAIEAARPLAYGEHTWPGPSTISTRPASPSTSMPSSAIWRAPRTIARRNGSRLPAAHQDAQDP